MIRTKSVRAFSKLRHLAGLAGVAMFVMSVGLSLPVSIGGDSLANNPAMARGGGNGEGNGGGRGNGRGGGDGGKHLRAVAQDDGSSRRGNATGHGHASSHNHQIQIATANEFGQMISRLGSLNAAHAAPQAFENADGNSVIGALRDYMDALVDYIFGGDAADAQGAADALVRAANKDAQIDTTFIDAVNGLLDGKSDGFNHETAAGNPIHESEDDIDFLINLSP